jgi:hypothetical protein
MSCFASSDESFLSVEFYDVLPHGRLIGASHQCVAEFSKEALRLFIVNVGIRAVEVAQGFRYTPSNGLKDKPSVIASGPRLQPPEYKT